MHREEEGVAELKRALELDPFSLAIRTDMIDPLVRLKQLAEARQILNDGLQIDPNWYSFPMKMADILRLDGRSVFSDPLQGRD